MSTSLSPTQHGAPSRVPRPIVLALAVLTIVAVGLTIALASGGSGSDSSSHQRGDEVPPGSGVSMGIEPTVPRAAALQWIKRSRESGK